MAMNDLIARRALEMGTEIILKYSRLHVSGTQLCPAKSSTYVNIPLTWIWAYKVFDIESLGVFWLCWFKLIIEVIYARCLKVVIQVQTTFLILGFFCFFRFFGRIAPKFFPNWRQKMSFFTWMKEFHLCDKKSSFFIKMCPQKMPLMWIFHLENSTYVE